MPGPPDLERGIALHRGGDLVGAARAYERVLAADPDNADALHLLGLVAYRGGRLDDARALIGRALARDPGNPVFHANLGNVAKDAGDAEGAVSSYRRALAVDPRMAGARNNLGAVLLARGERDEAIACFREVVAHAPQHARAWLNLGTALAGRGHLVEAADALRRAVAVEPGLADAWSELGLALGALGNHAAAVDAQRMHLQARPASATAHADLALALHRAGDLAGARDHYERAIALQPDALQVRCNLLALLQKMCDWAGVDRHWPPIRAAVEAGRAGVPSGLLIAQPGASAALQLAVARANAAARARATASVGSAAIVAHPRRRVAFLSADFREHATAYLTTELFELLDRDRFEVILLSYGPDDASEARARLQRAADRFVDLREETDDGAAARIAALGIDILVDLNGDTDNGRIGIASRRPAPIAVSWLGFPGTVGDDCYDYLVADPHVVPDGEERWYAETVVRLPDCYQCNDRRRPRPPSPGRAASGLPPEAFVLCCFNQSFKITRDFFDCWLRILRAEPRALLWLLQDNASASAALLARARESGVEPGRIVIAQRRGLADHLARYRVADLAVDTFPYTSHTTASDALWMGCPLVTVTGATFASRVATSLLRNVGLGDLAVADAGAYERTIRDLIDAPARLAGMRATLEQAGEGSALFDTPRFVRGFEDLLARIAAGRAGGGG